VGNVEACCVRDSLDHSDSIEVDAQSKGNALCEQLAHTEELVQA